MEIYYEEKIRQKPILQTPDLPCSIYILLKWTTSKTDQQIRKTNFSLRRPQLLIFLYNVQYISKNSGCIIVTLDIKKLGS